ncbi:MAG: hypothetical protein FXF47_06355 [Candidatus Mcinerneyibacterium aminivorans]|uniref:peptidylprolyl isomerase n=1 Tax=Candidatus Mcinerneyibacterium aminivorans TaxID=2703815 RepID=A0A5D0MF57_9BACT|nr:MAG: hypothetical protein FXF47_06355 [Candidatus Mcinerneyibacterium aminivorans]
MRKILVFVMASLLFISCAKKVEVANVGDQRIFEKDIEAKMQELNQGVIKQYGEKEVKKRILDSLITRILLLRDLKDKDYDKNEEIIDSWENMKEDYKLSYFTNKYIKNKADIDQDKLKEEYEQRKEQFKIPEKIKASHILIKSGEKRTDEEAKKKINEIKDKIKKDGSNFKELAKEYSEGPSAKKGGDLGYFSRGRMVKSFEDKAFSLKKGEFTQEPVKTKFGYHLIYVEDHQKGGYKKFKEVADSLKGETYREMLKEEYGLNIKNDGLTAGDENAVVASVEKLNLEYTLSDYKKELANYMDNKRASRILNNPKAASNTLEQILMRKIYEDKMKELDIYSSENYREYMNDQKDEFLVNSYVQNEVIGEVNVTDKEVDQYISYLKNRKDGVSNITEQQKRSLKQRIARTKQIRQYRSYVDQLKSKANINIKDKYKDNQSNQN